MSRVCRECKKGTLRILGLGPMEDTIEVECTNPDCGEVYEVEMDGLGEAGLEAEEAYGKEMERSEEEPEPRMPHDDTKHLHDEPKTVLRFTDGVELDMSGPLRAVKLKDGWYVLGNGMSVPVATKEEAESTIRQMTKEGKGT